VFSSADKLQGAVKWTLFVYAVGSSAGTYKEIQAENTRSIIKLEASVSDVYQAVAIQSEQIKHLSEIK
jgi:hypothetical protein